jgi:hypothetical protein
MVAQYGRSQIQAKARRFTSLCLHALDAMSQIEPFEHNLKDDRCILIRCATESDAANHLECILNSEIEKINLRVLCSNERAIGIYKKFGFVEEGHCVSEIKYEDGTYVDELLMARFV